MVARTAQQEPPAEGRPGAIIFDDATGTLVLLDSAGRSAAVVLDASCALDLAVRLAQFAQALAVPAARRA